MLLSLRTRQETGHRDQQLQDRKCPGTHLHPLDLLPCCCGAQRVGNVPWVGLWGRANLLWTWADESLTCCLKTCFVEGALGELLVSSWLTSSSGFPEPRWFQPHLPTSAVFMFLCFSAATYLLFESHYRERELGGRIPRLFQAAWPRGAGPRSAGRVFHIHSPRSVTGSRSPCTFPFVFHVTFSSEPSFYLECPLASPGEVSRYQFWFPVRRLFFLKIGANKSYIAGLELFFGTPLLLLHLLPTEKLDRWCDPPQRSDPSAALTTEEDRVLNDLEAFPVGFGSPYLSEGHQHHQSGGI